MGCQMYSVQFWIQTHQIYKQYCLTETEVCPLHLKYLSPVSGQIRQCIITNDLVTITQLLYLAFMFFGFYQFSLSIINMCIFISISKLYTNNVEHYQTNRYTNRCDI